MKQHNSIKPRMWATCHIYQGKLLIVGGAAGNQHYAEICLFDFESATWEVTKCEHVIQFCKTILKGNHLYVIGGSTQEEIIDSGTAKKIASIVNGISDDVILNILKYLKDIDINRMILVSKTWNVAKVARRMFCKCIVDK